MYQSLAVVALAVLTLQACSPAPGRRLTEREKRADIEWVWSVFHEEYAPLDYKEQRQGFKFDDLTQRYIDAIPSTMDANALVNNEKFYALLHQFVSEVADAHTSSSIIDSSLPERARVAYLGFKGKRKGEGLVVTELLPSIKPGKSYPLEVGDVVTELDGVGLKEIALKEMTKSRNLGHEEANATYLMSRIFARVSTAMALPAKPDAVLTVQRGGSKDKTEQVTLPWVVKDLVTFTQEQAEAKKPAEKAPATQELPQQPPQKQALDLLALMRNPSLDVLPASLRPMLDTRLRKGFFDSFFVIDTLPLWSAEAFENPLALIAPGLGASDGPGYTALLKRKDMDPRTAFKAVRSIPSGAIFLDDAVTYPVYITREKVMGAPTVGADGKTVAGKETGARKLVAYMLLSTFSPDAEEEKVLAETKKTLKTLADHGVRDLVIDMIDNGGGSLSLGMKLAQLLSKEKVAMPEIEFRLNDTWIDEMRSAMDDKSSPDTERELYARVYRDMSERRAKGNRLSSRWNSETLVPWQLTPNADMAEKLNVVVLVNEMCASMCDIFTAILKDNGMATVVGSRTMGAGGNVVDTQSQSPNAHLSLRQTQSLILRKDGTYIENNGVKPDVELAVHEGVTEKYEPARKKAIEVLVTESAAVIQPAPAPAAAATTPGTPAVPVVP